MAQKMEKHGFGPESPQAQRTRELIRRVLLEMMEEGDFEHITMKSLAERTRISRSTLYRYYECIYDAMCDCFAHYCLALTNVRPQIDDPCFLDILYANALSILQAEYRYAKLYQGLTKNRETTPEILYFLKREENAFSDYSAWVVKEITKNKTDGSIQIEYLITACQSATAAITEQWMQGGYKEPAETIARYCTDCFVALADA
jgi:AcrR family transcriptional regulator